MGRDSDQTAAATNRFLSEMAARRAAHYAKLNPNFHMGWYRRLMAVYRHAISINNQA